MLGWLIVAVVYCLAIWMIVAGVKSDDDLGGANKIFGILFMGLILLYPACDYCSHRIEPAPRLEAYEMTILQTKTLIGERNINLQDMEITKTLAGVIKERNEYIASLKVAQRNPFCLFKPKMNVVNTIYQ